MRSYGAMAGRYLKQQRRKSILTIVGIILSVALISALGTMGQALKDNALLNTKYESGSFHIGYNEPTPDLYKTLNKHMLVDQIGVLNWVLTTELQDSYSVEVITADKAAFDLLPIHLQEGRLPTSVDEIIIEQWMMINLPGKPKLNETTTLTGPDGINHSYQVVGILKNQKLSQVRGSARAYSLIDPAKIVIDSNAQLFLTLKSGVDISSHLDEFKKLNEKMFTNFRLLALMGESSDSNVNNALSLIFGVLIGLVVLSTVAVIYNAFHIAVLERIRQFGLLRTIGASPAQIRNLVFREATVLSAIGVPLGLLVGWSGLWLVLWLMTQSGLKVMMMEDFHLTFHWWIMGGSFVIGFLAVYLAAWLPARKASSVSPVEAVKGAGSIVRESYRRLRIPSLLTLLGIEGQMASNNIRRNRTKFRITTFSIVVSITLFIVFHYFTQQALSITTTTNENDRIAFQITKSPLDEGDGSGKRQKATDIVTDEEIQQFSQLPGVRGVYGIYKNIDARAFVPDKQFNLDFENKTIYKFDQAEWDNRANRFIYSQLILYDEARFDETKIYIQSGDVDPVKLAASDGVLIVQAVKPVTIKGKRELIPLTRYKVGDKITLDLANTGLINPNQIREVTIAGILTQSPFDSAYQDNSLVIIAAKPTFTKLYEAVPEPEYPDPLGTARYGFEIALEDGADVNPIRSKLEELARANPGSYLIDYATQQKETRQFNLQMKIFVYSFLLIIGVIGSLNIVNTVQTNLLLRRREIGLLQAVGMTMGQIRKMASAEGIWFGIIGSFWGIILGVGLSYFLFTQLSNFQGFPFEFPWGAALIACGAAILVGLISVQGPLRRMEKANLLEELREEA
ncbi:ABC transporter permease [Cohnella abietis]|uniref:ABC transporter permease n=1 Tax=Cohnella abietis TaxID=2507935 RepID=A0A3T1CY73_9BACL|nr:ABC transporter permease [Cohnella abietis]BBI30780.1 ABC transporter permease [Cohnella abietis]